jgi:hypothetical protein
MEVRRPWLEHFKTHWVFVWILSFGSNQEVCKRPRNTRKRDREREVRFPINTINKDTSEDRMIALIVAGMWQVLGQVCVWFQRHRGTVRGHVMDRHSEGTAVCEVDRVEGGTDTASLSAKARRRACCCNVSR